MKRRGESETEVITQTYRRIPDPNTVTDHAALENPAQFATGISDVFVNVTQVLKMENIRVISWTICPAD